MTYQLWMMNDKLLHQHLVINVLRNTSSDIVVFLVNKFLIFYLYLNQVLQKYDQEFVKFTRALFY